MRNVSISTPRPSSSTRCQIGDAAGFHTTRWSVVLRAGGRAVRAGDAAEALEKLCRAYWAPIHGYVLRAGHDAHTAQDLTQEFFSRLLEGNSLTSVHPTKGRFRSFLLASLKNFLANEWDRSQCLKRGGGKIIISLDAAEWEEREGFEPPDPVSPEKLFERRWAETVLARVNARLRREYEAAGQGARFEALKVYLLNEFEPASYAETASRLGITESAAKSAIYKLRHRYGEMFRVEIAHTVGEEEEVEEEIRHLLSVFSD